MSVLHELRGLLRLRVLQLLALSLLVASMAAIAIIRRTTIRDPDTWWHLKVGEWIVANHAVPFFGVFSRTAATHPWIAYSWGYEVLLSRAYAWFGLVGFALFGVVLTMAVAFVLFCTLYRLCGRFWLAWILSFIGNLAFLFSLMPRPVFFTMIFFAVVLTLLVEAQRSGKIQPLYWLPLIFALWANIHIQFVYGLFVVGLFAGIHLIQQLASSAGIKLAFLRQLSLPWTGLFGILAGCFAACLLGPYTYHLYGVVAAYSNSHVPYYMISELSAFSFNFYTHYVLLLLTAGAFYAVGWRKKLDLFQLSLLIVASVIAFRTQRDAWFLGIAALVFIADMPSEGTERAPGRLRLSELAGTVAIAAIFVFLAAGNLDFNGRELDRAIAQEYPVDAVNFLRKNSIPGPIYNELNWGGFLTWYAPEYPVAIDGRNDLYGDDLDLRAYTTEIGDYTSDPYLNEAGFVLLPKKSVLAKLLSADSHFRVVYRDTLAVVYARQ